MRSLVLFLRVFAGIVACVGIVVGIVKTEPTLLAGCTGLLAIALVGESFY